MKFLNIRGKNTRVAKRNPGYTQASTNKVSQFSTVVMETGKIIEQSPQNFGGNDTA